MRMYDVPFQSFSEFHFSSLRIFFLLILCEFTVLPLPMKYCIKRTGVRGIHLAYPVYIAHIFY